MALTPSRRITRAVLVALALLLVVAAVDGLRLWRHERLNALIEAGQVPPEASATLPETRFAAAYAQAASGADEASQASAELTKLAEQQRRLINQFRV